MNYLFDTTLQGTPVRIYANKPEIHDFTLGPSFIPGSSNICLSSVCTCHTCIFSSRTEVCISAVKRLLEPELRLTNPELFL